MLFWVLERLFWFSFRVGVTLLACVTLQRIILEQGYRCELKTLEAAAVTSS